jgi:hypothetical protein
MRTVAKVSHEHAENAPASAGVFARHRPLEDRFSKDLKSFVAVATMMECKASEVAVWWCCQQFQAEVVQGLEGAHEYSESRRIK